MHFLHFSFIIMQIEKINELFNNAKKPTKENTKPKYDPCNAFVNIKEVYAKKACTFSKEIQRNIKKIYSINKGINREKYCLHYKFWVYEKLKNVFAADSDKIYNNGVIRKFNYLTAFVMNGFIYYRCQYYFSGDKFNDILLKVEKKIYIYDYFNNYYSIKNRIVTCKDVNTEQYNECLTSVIKLYNQYKKEQCRNYENFLLNNCDDYFLFDEKYNPQILLSPLNICKETKSVNETDVRRVTKSFCTSINSEISK